MKTLPVTAALRIGMSKLIHQENLRLSPKERHQIKLPKFNPLVVN